MGVMTSRMNTRVYNKTKAIEQTKKRIEQCEVELDEQEKRLQRQQEELRNLYIEGHGFTYMQPLLVRQETIDFNRNRFYMIHWDINDVVFLKSINEKGEGRVEQGMTYMKDIPLEILEIMRLNLTPGN